MHLNKVFLNKLFVSLAVALLVSACGDSENKETKSASQVVAKVNGDEISIHQVNFQLSRLGALDEEQSKAASRKVLEQLVDMQLLKQKAIEAKLDRDPMVLQAIEASKSQVLAQAYIQKEMATETEVSQSEIDDFYNEHPELFEERRVFNLQEIAIENSIERLAEIEQIVAKSENLSSVAEWLKSNDFKFALNANIRSAEQLPSAVLKQLQTLSNGDIIVIANDSAVNVLSVAASEMQSITREKATPIIEKHFANKTKGENAKLKMAVLKKSAKIEYLEPFSDMQSEAELSENSANDKPVTSSKDEGKASLDVRSEQDSKTQSTLDKGLTGF